MSMPENHCFIRFADDVRTNVPGRCQRGSTESSTAVIATRKQIYRGSSIIHGIVAARIELISTVPCGFQRAVVGPEVSQRVAKIPYNNKGELRLAAWYKPNTRLFEYRQSTVPIRR